jgi:hypothetical protein
LELFSLEREGRPVAGRPFHLFLSLRSTHRYSAFVFLTISAPDASRSAAMGLAAPILNRILSLRSTHRYSAFVFLTISAPDASRSAAMGLAAPILNRILALRSAPLQCVCLFDLFLLLMQAAQRLRASRLRVWWTKFVALLQAGRTFCGIGKRSFWLWFDRLFQMSDLEGIKGWALRSTPLQRFDLIIQS